MWAQLPTTGWLKIKYPTRQYAISLHGVFYFEPPCRLCLTVINRAEYISQALAVTTTDCHLVLATGRFRTPVCVISWLQ